MKWILGIAAALAILAVLAVVAITSASSADKGPQVGQPAPDFKLVGSDGNTYTLADFRGKQAVVLAWFPKAFTGG